MEQSEEAQHSALGRVKKYRKNEKAAAYDELNTIIEARRKTFFFRIFHLPASKF